MAGQVTTQGDRVIRSNIARRLFQLDGKGIKIGIISDSFNAFGEAGIDIRNGELPGRNNPDGLTRPVQVLKDFRSGIDEGRALAQIIFDVAPGAELLFHTTGETEEDFVQAVKTLTGAGVDIIVDDILLSTSTFFQDGVSAQAITEAVNQGITYVTAAGNSGDRSYESEYRPSTTFTIRGRPYEAHDFDPGQGIDVFQEIRIPANTGIDLILNWDQASGAVNTDLDLFILESPQLPDADSNLLEEGVILTRKAADPSKRVVYSTSSTEETVYLLIARPTEANGTAPQQVKWISFANASDGNTTYQYVNDTPDATGSSTIYGHQNARAAIAVGAIPFRQSPAFGVTPARLEPFSSTGSSPILFDPQGNRLPTPDIRQKPDIVAPDQVQTTVFGFRSFSGTSAAAPHVAAVAALMLQRAGRHKRLTPAQILAAMQKGVFPVTTAKGLSVEAGLLQADSAVLQAFGAEISGTSSDDTLQGGDAAENLLGLAGADSIRGAGGFDALFGHTENDSLIGGSGNDYLVGGLGADTLSGNQGRDRLHGGAGHDRLAGMQGKNDLVGGSGKDIFGLHRRGVAEIQDFHDRIDRLELPRGVQFRHLELDQTGQSVWIMLSNRAIAMLKGVEVDRLTAADFVAADSASAKLITG